MHINIGTDKQIGGISMESNTIKQNKIMYYTDKYNTIAEYVPKARCKRVRTYYLIPHVSSQGEENTNL